MKWLVQLEPRDGGNSDGFFSTMITETVEDLQPLWSFIPNEAIIAYRCSYTIVLTMFYAFVQGFLSFDQIPFHFQTLTMLTSGLAMWTMSLGHIFAFNTPTATAFAKLGINAFIAAFPVQIVTTILSFSVYNPISSQVISKSKFLMVKIWNLGATIFLGIDYFINKGVFVND